MKIPSLSEGKVITVFNNNKTAGNGVIVQAADGTQYKYIHMKNAPALKVGDKVGVGQNLGLIGSTGRSTGPHLDLKISKGGKNIDPMMVINQMSKGKTSGTAKRSSVKSGGSSYTNTYKTKNEALKSSGYQAYKGHLSQALATGQVPENWVVALTELIGRESSWNPKADNKKSSAWGYGQFLDDTRALYKAKYPKLNYDNPVDQIILTAKYVQSRYGTPEKALEFWDKHKYY